MELFQFSRPLLLLAFLTNVASSEENSTTPRNPSYHLNPDVLALIAGHIQDGSSLQGTNLNDLEGTLHYRNVVGFEIDNYSKWAMVNPLVIAEGGHVTMAPREVRPGDREAMLARKTSFTATGTYGTVSWAIGNKRIVVMWDDPYNYDFYDNTLAVGIIPVDAHNSNTYDQMYKGSGTFTRREYSHSTQTIQYCDATVCVEGTMGTSHVTTVHIQVIPYDIRNLAPNLEAYAVNALENSIG